jgi:manganese efflux pump family protein
MGFPALLLVALALSVDNLTIAVAVGAQTSHRTLQTALRLPLVFGAFAAAAPALGWLAGSQIAYALSKYGSVVACAILVYVGWQTLRSAWQSVRAGHDASSLPETVALGFGTSVDSLSVGFALALTNANLAALSAVNGAVCATLSLLGLLIGQSVGPNFRVQSKIAAGVVLIAVGVRTLLVHL